MCTSRCFLVSRKKTEPSGDQTDNMNFAQLTSLREGEEANPTKRSTFSA